MIKYLEINLTEEVKNPYCENYKTLKKKIEEYKINRKVYHDHGLKEFNIVKMSMLLKAIYRINAIHMVISMAFSELE